MSGPAQICYDEVTAVEIAAQFGSSASAEVQLKRWQSTLLALASLVLVYGVAFGVTAAGGLVVHALQPARHIDIFASLHNMWVVGVLLGITVLWLLPPHPWAKNVVASGSRELPAWTAGKAEGGGDRVVTAQVEVPGPEPAIRSIADRRSDTPSLGGS